MLRRRRHINGEVTPDREKRDMQKELMEWREAKAARASRAVTCLTPTRGTRSNENTPRSVHHSSSQVIDENLMPWSYTASPPLTPAKRRGHVNAISPLMEVSQNVQRPSSDVRHCRASGFASPRSPVQEQPRRKSVDDVHAEISVWEESIQVPSVPPPSPSKPLDHLRRRERHEQRLLRGFLENLPASVHIVFPEEASPERRRLLTCLEQSEEMVVEVRNELQDVCRVREEAQELRPDSDSPFRLAVLNHEVVWPYQTALDMEDYLCRAHDLEVFWFFEARWRAHERTADELMPSMPFETIEEYPPNWPQWQIESVRSRSAMRARRRSTSQNRGKDTEAAPFCTL